MLPKIRTTLFRVLGPLCVLAVSGSAAWGANIFVTEMDLLSTVTQQGAVTSRGDFQLALDGGYKYRGELQFRYLNTDLEGTDQELRFYAARAELNDLAGSLDLVYWTGYFGTLGEGKHYAGPFYHYGGAFEYTGYYPLHGTGMALSWDVGVRGRAQTLVYQRKGSGTINSADLNLFLEGDALNFSLFTGVTEQVYRVGAQLQYLSDAARFYITAGHPAIEEGTTFAYDDLFVLIEQWFTVGSLNQVISVFSRPRVHYNPLLEDYVDTGARDDLDIHFDMYVSPPERSYLAGAEANLLLSGGNTTLLLSPHTEFFAGGVVWRMKLDFRILGEDRDFFTALLNVRTSF